MTELVLPYEIIIAHIALQSPAAFGLCGRLCKDISTALAKLSPRLKEKWIIRERHTTTNNTVVEFSKNPNGKYQGEFKITLVDRHYRGITQDVFIGNFHNGIPHGVFKSYTDGRLWYEKNYVYGALHGYYYEKCANFTQTIIASYVGGKLHGEYKIYDGNGYVVYECHYNMGKKEGIEKEYYDSGKLKAMREFKDDQYHGWVYSYNSVYNKYNSAELWHKGELILMLSGDVTDYMAYRSITF